MPGGAQPPVACVDIGGMAVKSGLLSGGTLSHERECPCPATGPEAVLQAVAAAVQAMPGAKALGVSTAGEVDGGGNIVLSDNIPGYTGFALKARLQQRLGLPAVVQNDVNAAALGELYFGAGKRYNDFVMLTLGTGVGGAIVQGGQLLRGAAGGAGEFGGMITHPEAWCPGRVGSGSLERYASATALLSAAQSRRGDIQTGRDVFAHPDDAALQRVIESWMRELCFGLVGLVHALQPGAVVLGGGVMQQPGLATAVGQMLGPMLKPSFAATPVLAAELGNRAGMLGAGALAQKFLRE